MISLRSSSGRPLVGLSLHEARLNPTLSSHEDALLAAPSPCWWGRVLSVDDERAAVSFNPSVCLCQLAHVQRLELLQL